MTMTKRGKYTLLGGLVVLVILLVAVNVLKAKPHSNGASLAGVPAQGVTAVPDYHLIPVLDMQGTDAKQVYLNTSATPTLFFATDSSESQKAILAIQEQLSKMGNGVHKPLVLVSTFVKTTDPAKAVGDAKAFEQKYKVTLPAVVQVGPPTEFVKQTPSLVYTDAQGTHILTDENKILDALNTVLALPKSQTTTQQKSAKK